MYDLGISDYLAANAENRCCPAGGCAENLKCRWNSGNIPAHTDTSPPPQLDENSSAYSLYLD